MTEKGAIPVGLRLTGNYPSASAGYHGFHPWGKAQKGFGEMEPVTPWRMSRRSRLLAKAEYNGTTGSARGVPFVLEYLILPFH
jgi:hypothetical protein